MPFPFWYPINPISVYKPTSKEYHKWRVFYHKDGELISRRQFISTNQWKLIKKLKKESFAGGII